jgi:predicted transcriptional regulator
MKRMSPWAYAIMLKHMNEGEMSCAELAEVTGLCKLTVYHYAKALHKVGMAHICQWHADSRGRHNIIIYRLGPGKDAKRPKIDNAKRCAQYRQRAKQIEMQRALHA